MADKSPDVSEIPVANQSEVSSSGVSSVRRYPKAKVSFSYLPATTKEDDLESILNPFKIDNWCEDEKFVCSDDGKKSIVLDVLGTGEQRNGVQMMRELCRLWCRRNRASPVEKPNGDPTPKSPDKSNADHSTVPGWLEFRQYDGDNSSIKKTDTVQILTIKSISFGSFKGQETFINHACIGQSTHTLQAKFEHDVRDLSVVLHERNTNIVKKIELSYQSLEAYVVFDVLLDGFRVFLPLLHPPRVYSSELTETTPYIAHPQLMTEGILWNRDTSIVDLRCDSDIIGRSSVLCLEYRTPAHSQERLTIENSPLWTLYTRLQRSDFNVYFSAISGILYEHKELKPDPKFLQDFDTLYAIESLFSRGSKFLDRCTPELIKLISDAPPKLAAPAITEVAHVWLEDDRFCNLENAFKTELEAFRIINESGEVEELPPHFVNVRRVVVTPTRILFLRPETIVENRTVREYGADRFLRVAFRDEDYGKLMAPVPRFMTKITDRIKMVLKDGIQVGSRRYLFLACSNSQLREHGCWFYAPDGTHRTRINSIRR